MTNNPNRNQPGRKWRSSQEYQNEQLNVKAGFEEGEEWKGNAGGKPARGQNDHAYKTAETAKKTPDFQPLQMKRFDDYCIDIQR